MGDRHDTARPMAAYERERGEGNHNDRNARDLEGATDQINSIGDDETCYLRHLLERKSIRDEAEHASCRRERVVAAFELHGKAPLRLVELATLAQSVDDGLCLLRQLRLDHAEALRTSACEPHYAH